MTDFLFHRADIDRMAEEMDIYPPANKGDFIYAFRFRTDFPQAILDTAPPGMPWVIRLAGPARYRFQATTLANILPSAGRAQTKLPDATPTIIAKNALNDERFWHGFDTTASSTSLPV